MRIVVYIEDWKNVDKETFRQQLNIYNSVAETVCIDNSVDSQNTNEFLTLVENDDLNNCAYNINDEFLPLYDSLMPHLGPFDMLILTNRVVISKASILELEKVANLADRHMFVIPRSNDGEYERYCGPEEIEDAASRIEWSERCLSEYSIMPCTFNDCVFIKGYRVMNHFQINLKGKISFGLEDSFKSLEYSLKKLSLDMANYGFSTVCANYAYAENTCGEKNEEDEKFFLEKRGKDYDFAIKAYKQFSISAVEVFGKHEGRVNRKRKLLYYITHITSDINGSSVHSFGVLGGLIKAFNKDEWEITVVSCNEAINAHKISERFDCKVIDSSLVEGVYDVGFAPFSLAGKGGIKLLSEHCYKIVVWPLDLIMLRSRYLNGKGINAGYEFDARMADGLIYFSESVRKDFEAYFDYVKGVRNIPSLVTTIMPGKIDPDSCNYACLKDKIPFDDFYLMMGNTFFHKMILPATTVLVGVKKNFVVVGGVEDYKKVSDNIVMFRSGNLSDEFMNALYGKCKGLIYPSVYEGFGLPPVQALNLGKPVFAMNIETNHELENLSDAFKGRIKYMSSLKELPGLIDEFELNGLDQIENYAYSKTWDDVGEECAHFIEKIVLMPMDTEKLALRRMIADAIHSPKKDICEKC